jgi:PhzF family phenazine biosynthesis protein
MDFLQFKQVDVFTRKPFFGNPVAVVLGAEKISTEDMQRIAAWTNLSETTFVLPPSSPGADYKLRIFTPTQELPFAGHPTIGSAHAVLESGVAAPRAGRLRQECLAGIIELEIENSASGTRIFLQTPPAKIGVLDSNQASKLSATLGIAKDRPAPPLRIDVGVAWLIADLGDSETIARHIPRLDQVQAISTETQTVGITIFGRAQAGNAQLHTRSFAPLLGVAEDPVCGSGNAAVAAYLAHTGLIQEIGADYVALQGMALGRAGEVAVSVENGTIRIGGFAVTCVNGSLRIG